MSHYSWIVWSTWIASISFQFPFNAFFTEHQQWMPYTSRRSRTLNFFFFYLNPIPHPLLDPPQSLWLGLHKAWTTQNKNKALFKKKKKSDNKIKQWLDRHYHLMSSMFMRDKNILCLTLKIAWRDTLKILMWACSVCGGRRTSVTDSANTGVYWKHLSGVLLTKAPLLTLTPFPSITQHL